MAEQGIFTVKIDTGNSAFMPVSVELSRILRDIADKLENGSVDYRYFQTILDSNGNDVGRYALKGYLGENL